ncbi:hypothetical protein GTP45_10630 [Pseudoduganella sp. FT55W]|uniref:Uncharacterized protein n=1 Tax=Duganella rivi TaxID=2666083 RepID=A0A7X4KBL8_9BURK|nr:hypothetical protein [Duganella rivi]MYM67285.1 hypothetical protein [Duganella rivi]
MGAIIAAIDWNAVVPVLLSGGVLAQGLGAMRWVARVEMRLDKLEKEQDHGKD